MKPFEYYEVRDISYPSKTDFTTAFGYKGGKCVFNMPRSEFAKNSNALRLTVTTVDFELDTAGYKAAMDAFNREKNKRHEEFFQDVCADNYVQVDHPKARKCFAMAWDDGHSCGYSEVANRFSQLSELLS